MHYLDYAATTPIDPQVQEVIIKGLNEFANPSSIYASGKTEKYLINQARQFILETLGKDKATLTFTSGATEANNWAIIQQAMKSRQAGLGNHIVATAIEHPSVKAPLEYLQKQGFDISFLNPIQGRYRVEDFVEASGDKTVGWVCMAVNNELGTLLPVLELGEIAPSYVAWFHVDAVQLLGKVPLDQFKKLQASTISISAHKIYGPKGIGGLIHQPYSNPLRLDAYLHGGGQENGYRSGTENTAYIKGFAKAIDLLAQNESIQEKDWADQVIKALASNQIPYEVNGRDRVKSILSLYLPDFLSSQLLIHLDMADIAISAGSACSAGSLQASHVLRAYFPDQSDRYQRSIRLSFGKYTQQEDIDAFIEILKQLKERKK